MLLPYAEMLGALNDHILAVEKILKGLQDKSLGDGELILWMNNRQFIFREDEQLMAVLSSAARTPDARFRIKAEQAINEFLKSLQEVTQELLEMREVSERGSSANPENLVTCSVCGCGRHESDVNIIDYPIDVCVICEPKYIKAKQRGLSR
ncbi:hypothetical protein ACFSR7_06085 [Cohnella sp. GCM10020058]|uniref:hypothetical protein n=1 Tax=Cohnella sp. GCM10020058 TaxID=3317330 RepID=UPI0036411CE2